MQPAAVHGLCIACLLVDGAARAWRLRVLVRAAGGSVTLLDALWANLLEDAAAALTPMRLGSIPARAVVLRRAGIGTGTIIAVSIAESVLLYPMVIVAAAAIALAFAPDWWHIVAPQAARLAMSAGRWLTLALVLGLCAWLVTWRLLPRHHHSARQTLARAWREARGAGAPVLGWSVALTLASMAARLAILPILTRSVAPPPPPGAATLGSFALLYGQLLLPTPSGAGAVELGFLAGFAGVASTAATGLLVGWRFYTAVVPIVAGFLATVARFAPGLTTVRFDAPGQGTVLGKKPGLVDDPRQSIGVGRQYREEVILDHSRADLLNPNLCLGGVELHNVRPEIAIGLRTDDPHEHLGAGRNGAGDADRFG